MRSEKEELRGPEREEKRTEQNRRENDAVDESVRQCSKDDRGRRGTNKELAPSSISSVQATNTRKAYYYVCEI